MPRNKCPWFKPTDKPARPGVYSVKVTHRGRPFFRHWDGKRWGRVSLTVAGARQDGPGNHGLLFWRGLLK